MATKSQILDELDDLLMDIEILIDSEYGKTDIATFKKSYTRISDEFMKKIQTILNNKNAR